MASLRPETCEKTTAPHSGAEFADLCLTTWLRRREKRKVATHYEFGKSWSPNRLTGITPGGNNGGRKEVHHAGGVLDPSRIPADTGAPGSAGDGARGSSPPPHRELGRQDR